VPFRQKKNPPANEADFERLCLRLLKAYWNCPTLELFGRRGERQHGIDILDMGGEDPIRAGQCKLYDPRKSLTPSEIHAEVEAARGFVPPIGLYALLTTAKVSTDAQKAIIEINRNHRGSGLFIVELFTWDRIDELLDEYPSIRDEEYRTLSGEAARQVQEELSEINIRLSAIDLVPTGHNSADGLHAEIDEARSLMQRGESQTARFLLQRLRTNKWDRMTDRHKFRVLSNLGAAYFRDREIGKAAQLFLEGAKFQPDDSQAAEIQAFAYQISLSSPHAFEEVTRLRERFPSSSRIAAIWTSSAPGSWTVEEVQTRLPAPLLSTPDVMTALAARSLRQGRFALCVQLAGQSIEQNSDWSAPRSLKAHAFLLQVLPSLPSSSTSTRTTHLREAERLFTEALTAAIKEYDTTAQAQCLLERAQIYLLLNEPVQADRSIEQAFSLLPDDPRVRGIVADMKMRHGRVDEAIVELRAAAAAGPRPDITMRLADALRTRGSLADNGEAINLLQGLVASPEPVLPGGREYVASILLRLLLSAERWVDAEKICDILDTHSVSRALVLAYRSRIAYLRSDITSATCLADDAVAALTDSAPQEEVRWIADLLSNLGRHSDALPLWQRVARQDALTDDTKGFFDCAMRLDRDDLILETCAALRRNGVVDRKLTLYEVQVLEKYDVSGAISVLSEYLQRSPDDLEVRLRRSYIGLTWNRPDVIDARPTSMPPVQDVDARTGRIAVNTMKLGGYPNEALLYGYELLRKHFGDPDAHLAFMFNLQPIDPRPSIDEPTEVKIGSAVSYIEDGEPQANWVIIEDASGPDAGRSEYSPEHPLSKALLGKKVGDNFVIAHGSVSDRRGTVVAILSKYVFRYQDGMRNWQIRFPEVPAVESVVVRRTTTAGKEEVDFSQVVAVIEQISSSAQRLKRLYHSDPVPINMIGAARGKGTVETMFYLAQESDASIFCCAGSADERDYALTALDVSNTWVLDPSSVATILLLNIEGALTQMPISLVLTQGTIAELNEMLREDTLFRGEGGVLTKSATGVAFTPITPIERNERLQSLSSRIDKLKGACKIVGCVELAKLEGQRRDLMIKAFGEGGAESIVLASKPGHVLWTDDSRLGSFARTEHGTTSAWTQVVLQWAAAKGHIPEEGLTASTRRLIGHGYVFTSPSLPALAMAAKMADWNSTNWPLSQAIDQLGSETIHLRDAATLAVSFMELTYGEALILDEKRRSIVRAALDRLGSRSGGMQSIGEIRRAVLTVFGLNVVGASDVLRTIDAWLRSRTIIRGA